MFGGRAIYHDGWIAATTPPAPPWLMGTAKMPEDIVNGYKWELYNLKEDYSEYNDLAAKRPDKLRDLKELFLMEATKYNVFPLDNSILARLLTPRPSDTAGRNVFVYPHEISGLPPSDAPSILNRSYTITAEVEIPEARTLGLSAQDGAEGMLVTMGGRFGGYGLYLLKGKPVFLYNMLDLKRFRWEGQEALTPGKHTIVFDFQYDGPGFGKGGTGTLRVDNNEVAKQTIPHTIPFIVTMEETFDVGVDTRTGLQAAVPLQREAEQGDLQPRPGGPDRVGPQGHASKHHQSKGLDDVVCWRAGKRPVRGCHDKCRALGAPRLLVRSQSESLRGFARFSLSL
jgi:arylsulfatase